MVNIIFLLPIYCLVLLYADGYCGFKKQKYEKFGSLFFFKPDNNEEYKWGEEILHYIEPDFDYYICFFVTGCGKNKNYFCAPFFKTNISEFYSKKRCLTCYAVYKRKNIGEIVTLELTIGELKEFEEHVKANIRYMLRESHKGNILTENREVLYYCFHNDNKVLPLICREAFFVRKPCTMCHCFHPETDDDKQLFKDHLRKNNKICLKVLTQPTHQQEFCEWFHYGVAPKVCTVIRKDSLPEVNGRNEEPEDALSAHLDKLALKNDHKTIQLILIRELLEEAYELSWNSNITAWYKYAEKVDQKLVGKHIDDKTAMALKLLAEPDNDFGHIGNKDRGTLMLLSLPELLRVLHSGIKGDTIHLNLRMRHQ